MSVWYVYLHSRADTGEPFYVGKGKDRRAYIKRCRSVYWNNIVKKHGYNVSFLQENLTEDECNKMEVYWIHKIGRWDLGKGPLVNFTNGGEGSSGRRMNEHTKKIISITNKNRPPSPIQKKFVTNLFKGKFGSKHNRSKAVICIETKELYGSMSEAARKLKIDHTSVSWSIKHKKPIYGMHFEIAS